MVQQISGLVSSKIGIKNAQSYLAQAIIAIANFLGVKNIAGYSSEAVPYSIDFSVLSSPQNIDLSSTQLKNQLGAIKTIFVDNSNNTASVSILCAVSRQNIIVPAGYQGYLPVASVTSQFQISTNGVTLVGFQFLNIDVEPSLWNAEPSATVIGSVLMAGSVGIDHSANQEAYPPAGMTKIITIASNTSRAAIGVENESPDVIQVWRVNEAAAARTMLALNNAAANGFGGGSWYSQTFKGSIEIWVPSVNSATDIVAAYED